MLKTTLGVLGALALTSLTAGCANRPLDVQNRQETYVCGYDGPIELPAPHYRCGGDYAALDWGPIKPLPACDVLMAAGVGADGYSAMFPRTRDFQVRVLPQTDFYSNRRIHAVLMEEVNFTVRISTGKFESYRVYVQAPRGYVTDFTSVPSGPAQAFHRTFAKTVLPAIAHDFLYATGRRACGPSTDLECGRGPGSYAARRDEERLIADEVIREGMRLNGSRWISHGSLYAAVRFGGDQGYGREEGLRFFDKKASNKPRVVVPLDEHDAKLGYPVAMREAHVRICPPD